MRNKMKILNKIIVTLPLILSSFAYAKVVDLSNVPGHWIGKELNNSAGYSYTTYDIVFNNDLSATYKIKEHCNTNEVPKNVLEICNNMNKNPEMVQDFSSEIVKMSLESEYSMPDNKTMVMRDRTTGQDRILTKVEK